MAPEQKRTYLPYSRGIDPSRLRIGNLVLDPYNPTTGLETKRLKYKDGAPQHEYWEAVEKWAGDAQIDKPCTLKFEASHEWSIAAAIIDAVHADVERQTANHAIIEGQLGRRFEIEQPLRFFKEDVFTQPGAQDWIRKQVSISFPARMSRLMHEGGSWKAPDIWVCTGIQLISGGRVRAGASAGASQGAGASLDPGMIHGIPTGQTAISIDGNHSASQEATNDYRHEDERVWAAQFYQLNVEFVKPTPQSFSESDKMLEKSMVIDLREVEDLKAAAVRYDAEDVDEESDDDEPSIKVAEIVGLLDHPSASDDQEPLGSKNTMSISDKHYVEAMHDVDWDIYDKYSKYWEKLVSYDK